MNADLIKAELTEYVFVMLDILYGKVYADNAQLGLLPLQIEALVTVDLILIINQYKIFVKENAI